MRHSWFEFERLLTAFSVENPILNSTLKFVKDHLQSNAFQVDGTQFFFSRILLKHGSSDIRRQLARSSLIPALKFHTTTTSANFVKKTPHGKLLQAMYSIDCLSSLWFPQSLPLEMKTISMLVITYAAHKITDAFVVVGDFRRKFWVKTTENVMKVVRMFTSTVSVASKR